MPSGMIPVSARVIEYSLELAARDGQGVGQRSSRGAGARAALSAPSRSPGREEGVETLARAGRKPLQSPGLQQCWSECCCCCYFFMVCLIQGR